MIFLFLFGGICYMLVRRRANFRGVSNLVPFIHHTKPIGNLVHLSQPVDVACWNDELLPEARSSFWCRYERVLSSQTGVIIWHQPKQCTVNGKSLKFTIHLHCLMPPKSGNLMIPDKSCFFQENPLMLVIFCFDRGQMNVGPYLFLASFCGCRAGEFQPKLGFISSSDWTSKIKNMQETSNKKWLTNTKKLQHTYFYPLFHLQMFKRDPTEKFLQMFVSIPRFVASIYITWVD